ncbi:MAG: hypothetical protein Q9196_005974, partial [Gyalolechia fulgens]
VGKSYSPTVCRRLLIITGVEQAMKLTPEHFRASYEIYMKYGNSSSAAIISVLNKLRESEGKELVVACAVSPGIALAMMILRRRKEASSGLNGSEQNGTNGAPNHNGDVSPNGAVNGNDSACMNGDSMGKEDAAVGNCHPST